MRRWASEVLRMAGGAGDDPPQGALSYVAKIVQKAEGLNDAAIKQTAAETVSETLKKKEVEVNRFSEREKRVQTTVPGLVLSHHAIDSAVFTSGPQMLEIKRVLSPDNFQPRLGAACGARRVLSLAPNRSPCEGCGPPIHQDQVSVLELLLNAAGRNSCTVVLRSK